MGNKLFNGFCGFRKILSLFFQLYGLHDQNTIGLIHGDCEEDALYLKKIIEEKYGYNDFLIQPIGPSIGAHSGPGTVGLIFLGEHR